MATGEEGLMAHIEFGWKTSDGLGLYGQGWEPETKPKGVVSLVHGLGEHSGRYEHVAAFLNQAGYALLGFDLRGHGKSEGQRGYAPGFGVLLEDISLLVAEARRRYGGSRRYLYGHSLGGNLVLEYLLRGRAEGLSGVIVTGPCLRTASEPPAWKVALGRIMYRLWPRMSMRNEIEPEVVSRDRDVVEAYKDDPLVHDRLTVRVGIDLLESGLWILEQAGEASVPVLLMHGGADRLTSVKASREFVGRAGEWCTLKIWEGLYHEIHNEPEKGEVLAYLLEWLESKGQ